jgi:hypothetical protein
MVVMDANPNCCFCVSLSQYVFAFRVVFTECTPETCPCGDLCSNQRISKQDWAPAVEKFVTKDRGFGVRTLKPIESSEYKK